MGRSGKTELQRRILLTWYDNPSATNKEIADLCNCSSSYVSQIKNRFDGYHQFEAMMDRQDQQMERMFGDDIFATGVTSGGKAGSSDQPGLADAWEDIPNNPAGLVIKGIILMVLLYAALQIVITLI